jgi:hypothetical protein
MSEREPFDGAWAITESMLPPIPPHDHPDYWRLMYERREREAHLLSEELLRVMQERSK